MTAISGEERQPNGRTPVSPSLWQGVTAVVGGTGINSRAATAATALALFLLFAGLFAYVQYGAAGLAGHDGYYHIKMAYLMRQEGLKPDFVWLPFTILNAGAYYDHHFLYHIYLALFAWVDPAQDGGRALTEGAKIASVILPALAFVAIWWLLRRQEVPWAALWALGLFAVSEAFLYRMSMARAQSASLLVLALGLHWLLQDRHRWLLPLGFLYVWLYNAFPLLLVVAGVYVAAVALTERRFAWQALVYPALGIGLGLLINPYFPQNIAFIIDHIVPKLGESSTRVGNEWYPYETWTLVQNSGYALVAFLLGVLALGWQERRIDRATLVALGLTAVFGLMLFKARRFVEYFPAFVLIFTALAGAPLLRRWQREWSHQPWLLPALMLLLLLWPVASTVKLGREAVGRSLPPDQYAAAALWLHRHAAPGEIIFQTDWDDFPRLFFYNSQNIYTAGLDPTYMELHDAVLFDEWVSLTRGRTEQPSHAIRERFGGSYVFTDHDHKAFLRQAAEDPGLEEVYRDDYAVIFRVLAEEQGEGSSEQ
jgi:hypothetical protein